MIKSYDFIKNSNLEYQYTREDGIVFSVIFEDCKSRFKDACVNCHRMWEINWFSDNDKCCRDVRSGRTVVEIIKDFLKSEFNDAVIYKVYDGPDKKLQKRDILFNRLIKQYSDDEIERVCNEFETKDKLCLIMPKNNPNFEKSVEDINYRCAICPDLSDNRTLVLLVWFMLIDILKSKGCLIVISF